LLDGAEGLVGDTEGGFPSTCAQIDSTLRERTFESTFDRVFFLDQGRGEVQELKIGSRITLRLCIACR
jgi:hypothetical protein